MPRRTAAESLVPAEIPLEQERLRLLDALRARVLPSPDGIDGPQPDYSGPDRRQGQRDRRRAETVDAATAEPPRFQFRPGSGAAAFTAQEQVGDPGRGAPFGAAARGGFVGVEIDPAAEAEAALRFNGATRAYRRAQDLLGATPAVDPRTLDLRV